MSDESDDPTVIAFPRPQTSPPKPESDPPEKIGLFEASITLRDLLAEVIGGDYTKLDWSVAEALRLIDPGEKSPPLMRYSARMHLRKIAGEIALGREKPTMRSGASYAVVALAPGRADPPPPRPLEIPWRKATVKLDLRKSGVCNLCGRKHSEPGMFTMSWVDPVLGAEVTAQFSGQCVAEAISGEFQRKGQAAAAREEARELGYWKAACTSGRRLAWTTAGTVADGRCQGLTGPSPARCRANLSAPPFRLPAGCAATGALAPPGASRMTR